MGVIAAPVWIDRESRAFEYLFRYSQERRTLERVYQSDSSDASYEQFLRGSCVPRWGFIRLGRSRLEPEYHTATYVTG